MSGVYFISVTLGGAHITGSPFRASVIPPSPRHCRLLPTPLTVLAGGRGEVEVEFADASGHATPLDASDLSGVMKGVEAWAEPVRRR